MCWEWTNLAKIANTAIVVVVVAAAQIVKVTSSLQFVDHFGAVLRFQQKLRL